MAADMAMLRTTFAGKTKSDGLGSRFHASGQLFTISAKDDQIWVVHEAVLSESPVLAKMCQTPMVEANTKFIKIPEDDPSIFGRLLEYLYCGDYSPWITVPSPVDVGSSQLQLSAAGRTVPERDADLFASVYIMADKYQLEQLQRLTICKIKLLHTLSDDAYYSMVQKVYDGIPSSDSPFRVYFMDSAAPRLRKLQAPALMKLLDTIEAGGPLARDYFEAQHKALAKEIEGSSEPSRGLFRRS